MSEPVNANAARPAHVESAYNVLENSGDGVRLDDLLFALTVVMTYQRDQQITDKIKAMQGDQDKVKSARELITLLSAKAKDYSGAMEIDKDNTADGNNDAKIIELINKIKNAGIDVKTILTGATREPNTGEITKIKWAAPTTTASGDEATTDEKSKNAATMKTVTDGLDNKIKDLGTSLEMQNLELQQLMSRRTQGIEISTQIQAKLEKAKDSVIRNL